MGMLNFRNTPSTISWPRDKPLTMSTKYAALSLMDSARKPAPFAQPLKNNLWKQNKKN